MKDIRRVAEIGLSTVLALFLLFFPGFVVTSGLRGLYLMWLAPLLIMSPLYQIVLIQRGWFVTLSLQFSIWSAVVFALTIVGMCIGRRKPLLAGALLFVAGIISAPLGVMLALLGVYMIRDARIGTSGEWNRWPKWS